MITISAFADEIDPDLDAQMDVLSRQGVRFIDVRGIDNINIASMSLQQARQYHQRMKDKGFHVPSLGSPIGKIRIDQDFQQHLELLRHCCDLARAFGTREIRVFSFYASKGKKIEDQRAQVMDRLAGMVDLARQEDGLLWLENERDLYGWSPQGMLDIFATLRSPHLKCLFDPANFVYDGIAPYNQAWTKGLGDLTGYFHIKDKHPDQPHCCPAGRGHGQIPEILADLKNRNWSGVMTVEPHMTRAEQFTGFTGPDLFGEAVQALKDLLDQAALAYQ